jgi:DNA-binding IclR family transcriptional regulator
LRRHLVLVRQDDVAYDLQEFSPGACCIAAPIRVGRGGLVATLGISVPARRFDAEQKQLVKVIRDLAAEASAELGPATAPPVRPPEASGPSPGGGAGIA